MARQALYSGLAVLLTGRDLALGGSVTAESVATELVPVAVYAACTIGLSRWSARLYRKQLERERTLQGAHAAAERAREAKGALVATISHELRTPLNGVLGMVQTLLGANLPPEQRAQVEVIAESGRSLNTLLNNILDHYKLAAGKLSIVPAENDVKQVARHVEGLYRTLAADKGLAFTVTVEPGVPERLVFDAMRYRQCLSNLVSNAIKFTEAGSVRVTIGCSPIDAGPGEAPALLLTATVADTGIGIPAHRKPNLFQPFSQADDTIPQRFGGTGLGLSITRQLAEAMGGSVALESSPGKGSTFRLAIRAGAASPVDRPSLTGHRILVADDVETNRMVMRLFLQPLGIAVVEAPDGASALAALAGGGFDAAFIDLHMPDMGGDELALRIRRGEGGRADLPLLALTADSADTTAARAGDFDAVVTKPVNPRRLQTLLTSVIQRRAGRADSADST